MASVLLVIDIQDALSLSNDISVTDNIRAINVLISTYKPQDVVYIRHLEDVVVNLIRIKKHHNYILN